MTTPVAAQNSIWDVVGYMEMENSDMNKIVTDNWDYIKRVIHTSVNIEDDSTSFLLLENIARLDTRNGMSSAEDTQPSSETPSAEGRVLMETSRLSTTSKRFFHRNRLTSPVQHVTAQHRVSQGDESKSHAAPLPSGGKDEMGGHVGHSMHIQEKFLLNRTPLAGSKNLQELGSCGTGVTGSMRDIPNHNGGSQASTKQSAVIKNAVPPRNTVLKDSTKGRVLEPARIVRRRRPKGYREAVNPEGLARGIKASRSIRIHPGNADLFIAKKGKFTELVRKIAQHTAQNIHLENPAIDALQVSVESMLTLMFEDLKLLAAHGNRVTIQPKDMNLWIQITAKWTGLKLG